MCFSLEWLERLCVFVVIAIAIWSIIKLLLPLVGIPLLAQILAIVLWAIIAIMVIYIIFGLLSCLLGAGGGLSLMPHGR
jgi:hypothetical protein